MVSRRHVIETVAAALTMLTRPAFAHDWTGHDDPMLAEWFIRQRRKFDNMSCCGLGDAYKIQIIEEADASRPFEEFGVAEITDGSEIDDEMKMKAENGADYQYVIHRAYLPTGLRFRFSYSQMTREAEGNPTNSAWAFLSVFQNTNDRTKNFLSTVYCIVPLPPGV